MSWLTLSKKLAFITGGGSGIGAAVAKGCARAGANVAVVDRNFEAAKETSIFINTHLNAAGLGGRAIPLQVDVTSLAEIEAGVAEATKRFPETPLSISVNCAGITVDKFMHKMTEQDWDRVLNVNLKGTFLVTQVTSKVMWVS